MARQDVGSTYRLWLIGPLVFAAWSTCACGWVGVDVAPAGDALDGSLTEAGASDAGDSSVDDAAALDAGPECDLSGVWASVLDVQISWPTAILSGGTGTLRVWTRIQITQQDDVPQLSIVPCNVRIPDFALNPAVANEVYGMTYPLTVFDQVPTRLQQASSTARLTGALLSVPATAIMLGATLANPLTDAWPVVGSVTQADDDMNGKPAVHVNAKSGLSPAGMPYSFTPLDLNLRARADISYLAARLGFSSTVTLTSCAAGSGSASVSTFDTHVVGCRVAGSANDCDTTQRDFIDAQRPAYSAGAASQSLVRLTGATTCAAVRAALP
ncbi:MAG: hypothetical protein RL701_1607 [Pseudomonadota bacterium]